jgi:hypothetical protein
MEQEGTREIYKPLEAAKKEVAENMIKELKGSWNAVFEIQ